MSFFSIIIPVYNVEDYIEDCLKSVFDQQEKDYEVILVDDGSTDSSGVKCDIYEKKYENCIVIHKKNEGLDSARKTGLDYAKGMFTIFLDSDDMLEEQCLSTMKRKLNEISNDIDIVQCIYTALDSGKVVRIVDYQDILFPTDIVSAEEFFTLNFLNGELVNNVWSKIYRTSSLKNAELAIESKYTCEDIEMMFQCACKKLSYSHINERLIVYRIGRKGSITEHRDLQYFCGVLDTIVKIVVRLEKSNFKEKEALCRYFATKYLKVCKDIIYYNKGDRRKIYEVISTHKNLIPYANIWENKVYIGYKLFGIKGTNALLKIWKERRA